MSAARINRIGVTAALILAMLAGTYGHAGAASDTRDTAPHVAASPAGVQIVWRANPAPARQKALPAWPQIELGGYRMPVRTIALRLADQAPATVQLERLASAPWDGPLPPLADVPGPRPALKGSAGAALPDTPVVVLREGYLRGAHLAVVAIAPLFARDGGVHAVLDLQASIPGATLLEEDPGLPLAAQGPFLAAAPAPANHAALRPSWTVRVTHAGIQRLGAAELAAAGIRPADAPRIHLWRNGREVAIELRGDELRFYAPAPGDRWNDADIYWLTLEDAPGRRMARRDTTPASAPTRTTAVERGVWRESALYDSTLPGPDGDHWFAADLRTGPGQPTATAEVSLAGALPPAPGSTVLTVASSAYTSGEHRLRVTLGASAKLLSWSGAGDHQATLQLGEVGSSATLALIPGAAPDGVELDSVAWERPAALAFGGRGAHFAGVEGMWRYQLSGVPPGAALYDVSDPEAPVILTLPAGGSPQFQDGPLPRSYLLAGPGTRHTPAIRPHAPVNPAAPLSAEALYIAPAELHAALAPLIEHRRAQGHSVATIDVQAIYDAWSYGQVAPEAIRSFLRYAAASWPSPPLSVTLVGDGTSDPHGFSGNANINYIPPYLAMVDPWLGETACEACYAQLDGDTPLDDPLPDLALGRLPVKSAAELSALVAKIVAYERAPTDLSWQTRALFVADNYREADGAPDSAGDFAAAADAAAAMAPAGVTVERVYYDPWRLDDSGAPLADPWRVGDAAEARARTLAALSAGAGVVTYVGHSHTWQWAVTDPADPAGYLLGLYDPDSLTNIGRLPVVLEMTCLTAAFQTPARSGTTLDERLLLAPGGAAAVWGPTGMGVGHGHDMLQRGFFRALWAAPAERAQVGSLAASGYLELFAHGACCQETLRTYALLGDPLTPARALRAQQIFLPAVGR